MTYTTTWKIEFDLPNVAWTYNQAGFTYNQLLDPDYNQPVYYNSVALLTNWTISNTD
jgi:hypothetical protein